MIGAINLRKRFLQPMHSWLLPLQEVLQVLSLSTEEPKPVMKNNFSPPIIEGWHSDDESEEEISPTSEVKTVKPSIEKIKYNQDNRGREYGRKTVLVEPPIENALITQDRIKGYDWSYQSEEEIPTTYAFMALTSSRSSSSSEFEVDFYSKSCMKALCKS
nr:hypothetical protein [Tanacetum cinerariifolium]